MIKKVLMPAMLLALFSIGSMSAQEAKSAAQCCKKEAKECCKKEAKECCKQEAKECCKKEAKECCKKEAKECKGAMKGAKKEKAGNDTTVTFAVEPKLVCHNCENRVKSELRFEKGVKKIDASAAEERVTVTYDRRKSDVAKLKEAFAKIGYQAETKD